MHKVILEVRCNEFAMRDQNPHVPWSPAEIAEDAARCAEAGASILHYHARDPETGAPSGELALYAEIARRVRAACNLILTPTLGATTIPDSLERVAHIPALAADPDTRPDIAPVDLATLNIDPYRSDGGFAVENLIYLNPIEGIRAQAKVISEAGVKVEAALWNVGSARLLEALFELGDLQTPLLGQLALSDLLLCCHPASEAGLDALLTFLPRRADLHWMVLHAGGNLLPLIPAIVARGGHLALGLGDAPFRELGKPTNAEVIREAVRAVRAAGAEVATPEEARARLGLG